MRHSFIALLLACCFLLPASPSFAASAKEDDVTIQAKLDEFAQEFFTRANRNIRPCKSEPAVHKRDDGKYVAAYIELDEKSLATQLIPSEQKQFSHIAKLMYVECYYESEGATKDEALSGSFKRVKVRRLTELPRYEKGTWTN